jgi:hypothetical protein
MPISGKLERCSQNKTNPSLNEEFLHSLGPFLPFDHINAKVCFSADIAICKNKYKAQRPQSKRRVYF